MSMNRAKSIILLILAFLSVSCSELLDIVIANHLGKESGPASVSMEYDGIYMEAEPKEYICSQFYLRKHSFSYYLWAHFAEGALSVGMLISAGEEFELDRWYSLPTAATENIWESFAEVVFDYSRDKPEKEDKKAVSGRVKFTKFEQIGELNYTGEGYCTVEGEFEITLEGDQPSENAGEGDQPSENAGPPTSPPHWSQQAVGPQHIEVKNGVFYVSKSKYWDSRAMED